LKKNILLFIFCCSVCCVYAQNENLGGIVFDKDTKFRLTKVSVLNTRTRKQVFNNNKGEFFIDAQKGDVLISFLAGYKSDTLKVENINSVVVFLKRLAIPLPEVVFKDSVLLAKAKYEKAKADFNQAVRIGDSSDILNISGGGVGLGIDALWSAFSKEGKNARRLMEIMERDYQNNMIDQVFSKSLVARTTGLKGDKLLIFMLNYRPSYELAMKANEYTMISYIKQAFMRFNMSPDMDNISALKPIEIP
jgi:hypothetical protein